MRAEKSVSWTHADVAQLVAHHLAKVNVAGSSPVIRSAQVTGLAVEWPRGEARDCKSLYTGSNPVSTSQVQLNMVDWRSWLARFLDMEEVTGSSPVSTTKAPRRRGFFILQGS